MDAIIKVIRIFFYVMVVATLALYGADYMGWWSNAYWVWAGTAAIGASLIKFFLRFV